MQSFEYQLPLATDMETSFYHDNQRAAVKKMKSSMSLDFFGAPSSKKRATQTTTNLQPGLLGSPDLNMLKLASPELERMIIQQNGMVTTTPTPSQITNPKFVTEEQEAYARGFVDALAELHEKKGDHLPMEEAVSAVSSVPVSTMTTLMPPASVNMSMSMSDIPSSTTMINTVASLSSDVAMSTAGYQSQQVTAGIMSMPYTSAADQMNMSSSQSVVTSCADNMSIPSSSQHQYTTLLPPTSQHQQSAYNNSLSSIQENSRVTQLKQEEPQIVPNLGFSPPVSPINMANQEKIKLERKRERNRVAARKCRTRKLERISRLEDRVADLKDQNSGLVTTATSLRDQVCKLKSQIMEHVKNGCQVMMSQNLL